MNNTTSVLCQLDICWYCPKVDAVDLSTRAFVTFFSQATYPYHVCVYKLNIQISLHFFMEKYCFVEKESAWSFNCDTSTLQDENRRMNSDGVQVYVYGALP